MIGLGFYTPRDAAALLHEAPATVRRWAFGARRTRAGVWCDVPPLLLRADLLEEEGERALTFVELVELLYVQGFTRAGAPPRLVREAARTAARLYGTEHPFARRDFLADPRGIYGVLREADGGESLVHLAGDGQLAFAGIVRPYLRQLDFGDDGVASRWWPLGRETGVVCDPERQSGQPMVAEAYVRTRVLADAHGAEMRRGLNSEEAARDVARFYHVRPEHVVTATGFERWLRAA